MRNNIASFPNSAPILPHFPSFDLLLSGASTAIPIPMSRPKRNADVDFFDQMTIDWPIRHDILAILARRVSLGALPGGMMCCVWIRTAYLSRCGE